MSYCPNPYKESFTNMGAALKAQRRRRNRHVRLPPVEPYRCVCGRVHMASRKRGRFIV